MPLASLRSDAGRPKDPTPPSPTPERTRAGEHRLPAGAALLGGILSAISAVTPWWYLSTTNSRVEYLPGTTLQVTSAGGGGATSYASSGVASLGVLYELVLIGTVGIAVLAGALGGLGLARSTPSRWPAYPRAAALGCTVSTAVGVLLLAGVAVGQPILYRAANPLGTCSGPSPPGACSSFWGSGPSAGGGSTWGAGAGWYLEFAAVVLMLLSFVPDLVRRLRQPVRETA